MQVDGSDDVSLTMIPIIRDRCLHAIKVHCRYPLHSLTLLQFAYDGRCSVKGCCG